jgi:NDP-sugar pyrophosphorylase family protein
MVHRWFDVDTVLDLIKANGQLLADGLQETSDSVFLPKGDVMEIGEEVEAGRGIHLNRGVHLEGPLLLSPGCVVGGNAKIGPDVFLDENTHVGSGCHLKRLVASGESNIPDGMLLENAVIYRSEIHSGGEPVSK